MKKTISIKVGSVEESLAKFKQAWIDAEEAKQKSKPVETLHFENTSLMLKTLTPRRLELMQILHGQGLSSIRALAKKLQRDYRNVYDDVKSLHNIGLILSKDNKYYVPWDTIKTEIPVLTKAA